MVIYTPRAQFPVLRVRVFSGCTGRVWVRVRVVCVAGWVRGVYDVGCTGALHKQVDELLWLARCLAWTPVP